MKVYLENLGCPKNQVDGEYVLARLQRAGAQLVERPADADVILVNTCAFIEAAREESVETILELAEFKKRGAKRLFVIGCMAQRYADELSAALHEADAVFPDRNPRRTAERLAGALGLGAVRCESGLDRYLLNPGHYAYLKLAEGCDNRCSYCSIPLIKGRYRSRPLAEVVAEAGELVAQGVREINLVAQDVTYFGWDRGVKEALPRLIDALAELEGLRWIRVLYAHPAHVRPELIARVADNPKVCRYLDLPIQHASDRILRRMRRRVTQADLRALIGELRERVPEVVLRTTVLVGFPGETDEDFEELLEFLEWARFERIGVFGYSREEDTPAAAMRPQVPAEVVAERVETVTDLAHGIALGWFEAQVGRRLTVLVDGYDEDRQQWFGRTEWDAPEIDGVVWIEGDVKPGEFVECRIAEASPFELRGELEPAAGGGCAAERDRSGTTVQRSVALAPDP